MPLRTERLRAAIVALAVLLLLAIVGSFFYGRWRLRHIAQDLPARLGIQIQQSTQGFVLSKTEKGRPLFTLHAARAVEFRSGGRVSLHNVEIDLYNRRSGMADTIAGDDFEYDPRSQIVQSNGEAHIVLHGPATSGKEAGQPVRVTTHGLTFNQKTGVATCSGEVDFQMADFGGQAVGADYDSRNGQLVLESDVVLTTKMQGQPAVLHASHATYDRGDGEVHLLQPRYVSGTQSGSAEAATVLVRGNGSVERLDAQGAVRLASGEDMRVRAPAMQVLLDQQSRPREAHFSGGVQFTGDQPGQKIFGHAVAADVGFDGNGRANRVAMDGAVELHQQADAGKTRLLRRLAADHLLLNLLPSKAGNAQLQSANATGNAVFTSQSIVPGRAPQETMLGGQTLNAKFAAGDQLQQIVGDGQTSLKTVAANGDIDSSTGDTLQIEFAPSQPEKTGRRAASAAEEKNPMAAQSIRTAVQAGHVVLKQIGKKTDASASQLSTATAGRASYAAANDTLTLTGEPVFRDSQLEMTADRMELERGTGKMVSTGAVQTTLISSNSPAGEKHSSGGGLLDGKQPVHIIAERATVMQDNKTAIFSGRARLWQGGDTIEAPVIELSQKAQTLTAYGDASCAQCVAGSFLGESARSAHPQAAKAAGPSTFRVLSQRLIYSDAERKASFFHDVHVISSSGVLFADDAEIFLTPADRTQKARNFSSNRNNKAQSSVERIIAAGNIRLLQPGRSATGARLVYTASDGHFVLTGDEKNPPKVVDLDRGTITGPVLTFASAQQAIIVSGTPGHATTTKTRVHKK